MAIAINLIFAFCTFIPPKNWDVADPKAYNSERVKIGFLTQSKSSFCPSINLTIEEHVDVSMAEYLKAVKKIHESNRNHRWRDLGVFKTISGEARLTEIDMPSQGGELRLLQLIFLKDNKAYILTGAAAKEEFSSHITEFKKAFESLCVTENLIDAIPEKKKHLLEEKKIEAFSDMGPYFQAQLLTLFKNEESSIKVFNSEDPK